MGKLEAEKNIRKRLDEICEELLLDRETFIVIPGSETEPDIVQIVVVLRKEAILSDDELIQMDIDTKFKDLASNLLSDTDKSKLGKINSDLKDWLNPFNEKE
jgi:hypothetical protein